jgi:ParB family chromosome partitioning protein
MIQNIKITELTPHYNNPRKDLGDLAELAESIKSNGILQNLTVVPWFSRFTGVGADDPTQQGKMGYIVIIGHRRLAAAKLAGLTEVPCAITNMSPQEQMATMLLENMQRSDLTVYEQANGIQMMMNLGETVHSISEKTGFSETTVRRRVKLLELDSEKFKKSVERGATLMDYVELEKINDIELRNSVLDDIGTANFQWKLRNAIEEEKSRAKRQLFIAQLEKFAKQIDNSTGLQFVTSYYTSQDNKVEIPDDVDTVEYFFTVSQYGSITLYKKSDVQKETYNNSEWEETQKKRREISDALNEISKQAYQLRFDFTKHVSQTLAKKNIEAIVEALLWEVMNSYSYNIDFKEYAKRFGIELDEIDGTEDLEAEEIDEIYFNIIKEHIKVCPELHLLVITYLILDDDTQDYKDWNNKHQDNNTLNTLYNMLEKLGYPKSDEEQALCDGTHELFQK